MKTEPVVAVEGFTLDIAAEGRSRRVLDDVGFEIGRGEVLALVGESGSGKTLIGKSILRLLPGQAALPGGRIVFEGRDVLSLPEREMRGLRGAKIGAVFQEPMSSLNPALTVGFQISEGLRLHRGLNEADAREAALSAMEKVRIRDPAQTYRAYPHQFSGGMRQRIMIASVLALRPALLIADEPTTALDAVVRKEVMDLMIELAGDVGAAVLLISHDLAMVAEYARSAVVLKAGRIVEQGKAKDLLLQPKADYTRALVGALPTRTPAHPAVEGSKTPLLSVDHLSVVYPGRRGAAVRALQDASLDVAPGETVAVVGESGSGKTTIGKAILKLCEPTAGAIRFEGVDLKDLRGSPLKRLRRRLQIVFQDPFSSLDPRMTLEEIVAEPLRHDRALSRGERIERARNMLAEVGLGKDFPRRYPHELSGGQRQRVCIARAVVGKPRLVVADEPVSALDVTVQKSVLELLEALRRAHGFGCLFISHDLAVVEQIADRVVVMRQGRVVEAGSRDAIFDRPQHPYTRRLLAATPRIVTARGGGYRLRAITPAEVAPPPGHDFFEQGERSSGKSPSPVLVEVSSGHTVSCVPISDERAARIA